MSADLTASVKINTIPDRCRIVIFLCVRIHMGSGRILERSRVGAKNWTSSCFTWPRVALCFSSCSLIHSVDSSDQTGAEYVISLFFPCSLLCYFLVLSLFFPYSSLVLSSFVPCSFLVLSVFFPSSFLVPSVLFAFSLRVSSWTAHIAFHRKALARVKLLFHWISFILISSVLFWQFGKFGRAFLQVGSAHGGYLWYLLQ